MEPMTVKTLSEELKVSKPGIMKKIDEIGIRNELQKQGNKIVLSEAQANLIREAFTRKKQQKEPKSEPGADVIAVLTDQLRIKDEQIKSKDEQISRLQSQIDELLRTNADAVKASLGQTYLLAQQGQTYQEEEPTEEEDLHQEQPKKSFWSRLFG